MNEEALLRELAGAVGLAASYTEIGGRRRDVPDSTLRAVLEALGHRAAGPALADSLRGLAARRDAILTPQAAASFEPGAPGLSLNPVALHGERIDWTVAGDSGEFSGSAAITDLTADGDRLRLALPPLEAGYYQVGLTCGGRTCDTLLVRAPARAWFPADLERCYGVSVQLYEQLGGHSLGIGDLGDLAGLAEALGRMGVATLGLNPLHALFLAAPERVSPYSPSSRLALNPLYLDLRDLSGPGGLEVRLGEPSLGARSRALNAQPLVDYESAAALKLNLAHAAYGAFRAGGGDTAFAEFAARAPHGLRSWARYETIAADHGADWRNWPAGLREPDGPEADAHVAGRRAEYDFHLWLQWQADRQLGRAARAAAVAGMRIGLYHDLALGADPAGAEIWAAQTDFATTLSVGAPPDPLNPRGQNWGFPPFSPERLLARELAPFIDLIRGNMRHAGALRIDHVLGLNRLFVIPQGIPAEAGVYLGYPFDVLLAVIVLESVRARCLVVGEDLGTVPEGLREQLATRGVLSLRLLYFERDELGRPRGSENYPREALAAVGTHDLAPLAGFWRGEDITRMTRLGLWPTDEARAAAEAQRPQDCAALREGLARTGIPGAEAEVPTAALYRWLARAPSRLLMIQPEDALGLAEPVNVPGTTDEEPNWRRRRLPPWPEWTTDPRFVEVIRAIQTERGGPPARSGSALVATYRLQLHGGFGFEAAAEIVPYLARLGVSHAYVSPVMQAVPGSRHGYDVTDPARLDADRGGPAGFAHLLAALAVSGLGLVVDYVPNHMAAHPANAWWMDLLEWGLASRHGASFDIDWTGGEGRLVVPVLGGPLEQVLAHQQIELIFEPQGRFVAAYQEQRLPLAARSAAPLLRYAARRLDGDRRRRLARLGSRMRRLAALPVGAQRPAGLLLQAELARLAEEQRVRAVLTLAGRRWATDPRHCARLLADQHWKLMHWRHGLEEINYRRFFDIASLAALRMERPAVFAATHAGIRPHIARGEIAGLRLDHVDGLAAPGRYLEALARLSEAHGGGVSLWVEKILAGDESLNPWPVAGTTGYEFLNLVTRFFMPQDGCERLRKVWLRVADDRSTFSDTLERAKREVIEELFEPMLGRVIDALAPRAPVDAGRLRLAVVEALVTLPVYRAYPDAPGGALASAGRPLAVALEAASAVDPVAGEWLGQVLAAPYADEAKLPAALRDGVTRFWQLAAAAMGKGLEDTAFYRDRALLALDEVGGDPRLAGLSPQDLHAALAERARSWPSALSATETHDTKRAEDARMRLAMLAAHAKPWAALVSELGRAAASLRPGDLHPADEYLVWQTLLAVWPAPAAAAPAPGPRAELGARLQTYLKKALREARQRSSWVTPDEPYEAGVATYAASLLDPQLAQEFQDRFLPFAARLARTGALASLAATVLKLSAPGVPDLYQGSELWDLSLVDPDNRRPVDYGLRTSLLRGLGNDVPEVQGGNLQLGELLRQWADGTIKLELIRRLLALRRSAPAAFSADYRPLRVTGSGRENVLAFARGLRPGVEIAVLIARVTPQLEVEDGFGLAPSAWGDTLVLPDPPGGRWRELLSGRRVTATPFIAGELLAPLPAAVLIAEEGR